MSVVKLDCECYSISTNGEYAHVYLRQFNRTHNGTVYYGGEIAINSSFGRYAYVWGHCGESFKQFLRGVGFDYFMEKAAAKYKRFDFDKSMNDIKRAVIESRRHGDLSKDDAASIWLDLGNLEERGPHQFVEDLYGIELLREVTTEPYEYARESPTADCRGFWREMWPILMQQFQSELEPA